MRSLTEWKGVALLLKLIEWLDLVDQVLRREVVQLVGWLSVTEHHDQGSVKKLRTVDFNLICEGVPRELSDVTF